MQNFLTFPLEASLRSMFLILLMKPNEKIFCLKKGKFKKAHLYYIIVLVLVDTIVKVERMLRKFVLNKKMVSQSPPKHFCSIC